MTWKGGPIYGGPTSAALVAAAGRGLNSLRLLLPSVAPAEAARSAALASGHGGRHRLDLLVHVLQCACSMPLYMFDLNMNTKSQYDKARNFYI